VWQREALHQQVVDSVEATVGRGVVDDDDADVLLRSERLDAASELIAAVVRNDHDVDEHHASTVAAKLRISAAGEVVCSSG
jgi:hypothetical protein